MKIQGPTGEEMKMSDVASLPVTAGEDEAMEALTAEGDGDTAEEILASLPDMPVCILCSKKAQQVNSDGACCVCVPPEKVLPTAPSVAVPARPTLEVETEVNANLTPRIMSHVGRMRAWDLRPLTPELRASFSGAVEDFGAALARLQNELLNLAAFGFVAKTTPTTRLASRLEPGTPVELRPDQRLVFQDVYSEEQLDSLTVVRVSGQHVALRAGDGTMLGLVRLIHVSPKA